MRLFTALLLVLTSGCSAAVTCDDAPDPRAVLAATELDGDCGTLAADGFGFCHPGTSTDDAGACMRDIAWDCQSVVVGSGRLRHATVTGRVVDAGATWTGEVEIVGQRESSDVECRSRYVLDLAH